LEINLVLIIFALIIIFMERYIKYKRFSERIKVTDLQDFLDKLVTDGWEIITYIEKILDNHPDNVVIISVIILCGKRQNSTL